MACFRGEVFHLGRVNMHQKNSNHVGSHHVEGFQGCLIYKEDKYPKTIDTSDESPCTFARARSFNLKLICYWTSGRRCIAKTGS